MSEQLPEIIEGIKCYDPRRALDSTDFPSHDFDVLYETEDRSFWFRSRNRIITRGVARYLAEKPARFLEIGCGTGYVLKGLSELADILVTGADVHLTGLRLARKRLPAVELIQLNLTDWSLPDTYDGIGAFDVLEHIEQDEQVLRHVNKTLRPGGYFFATVPQHKFLWSAVDKVAGHKRRYSRAELVAKIREAGFQVRFVSSFVFMLFPLMCLSRLNPFHRKETDIGHPNDTSKLQPSPLLNTLFDFSMRVDETLIGWGCSLPFGGSLWVVAQKPFQPPKASRVGLSPQRV